jgi:hypothetical protein
MKMIMCHLKRKHDALYAQLVWMEPFGDSTWCVWIVPSKGIPNRIEPLQRELARSSSKWVALFRALKAEVREQ